MPDKQPPTKMQRYWTVFRRSDNLLVCSIDTATGEILSDADVMVINDGRQELLETKNGRLYYLGPDMLGTDTAPPTEEPEG